MKITTTKIFIIVVTILAITLIGAFIYKANELNEYTKDIPFMDKTYTVKIYVTNEIKANEVFEDIKNIYNTYDKLINHNKEYKGNLYSLNNGSTNIHYKLHKMIEYGYLWYQKSNYLFSIALGNIYDGNDTLSNSMNDILVNEVISDIEDTYIDKSVILSNDVKINLDYIAKGYVNNKVANYLNSMGIKKYMINTGSDIVLGESFKNKLYSVGIINPIEDKIYKLIKGENIAISTIGDKNIIDPTTLKPANNIESVTVITSNSKDATALANILYLMDPDEGLEFISNYDAEVIWFLSDDSVKTTKGITKYE